MSFLAAIFNWILSRFLGLVARDVAKEVEDQIDEHVAHVDIEALKKATTDQEKVDALKDISKHTFGWPPR